MLKPNPYMDLNTCVLRCAGGVIGHLSETRWNRRSMASVERFVVGAFGEAGRPHIRPALELLFVLGVVRYDERKDQIILTPRSNRFDAQEAS